MGGGCYGMGSVAEDRRGMREQPIVVAVRCIFSPLLEKYLIKYVHLSK